MKKFLTLVLALSMLMVSCFAFASCGNNGNTTTDPTQTPVDPFDGKDPYDGHLPEGVTEPTEEKYFKTKDNADGTVSIVGILADAPETIIVPAYINGKLVTEIAPAGFTKTKIRGIILPSCITKIGEGAFSGCGNLYNIYIPESVTEIGNSAFQFCGYLTDINFLPKSITKLSDRMFQGCDMLQTVKLPESITEIGSWVFVDCKSLTSVTLDSRITAIGKDVFKGCTLLRKYYVEEGSVAEAWVLEKVESGEVRENWVKYPD